MFDPTDRPQLFALPPGADFPRELIAGIEARLGDAPPERWAEVEIFVNTTRMQRRLRALFAEGPARLMPRIRLLTRLAADPLLTDLPAPRPDLDMRLDLARLVAELIRQAPDLAAQSAAFDLAESLAALFQEMHEEGVTPDDLAALDISEQSAHWQRALRFVGVAGQLVDANARPTAGARLRASAEALVARWRDTPPTHPVIVAGSTGSRGPVALLMEAVARLPQGAVVLPGLDITMPPRIWDGLDDALASEDHPQYRFARLARALDTHPADIPRWTQADPVPARNALISMALRPAPVTDQWRAEGPGLGDMAEATRNIALIEARDPDEEAQAIAIRLRRALDAGQTAALVTPDRVLTRRVQAALDRWELVADDSAGAPLHLSAPGRLLCQVAAAMAQPVGPEALLALLRHPLVARGADRNDHALRTRRLDLWLRGRGAPHPDAALLDRWATVPDRTGRRETDRDPGAQAWARWVGACLDALSPRADTPLSTLVADHLAVAEHLVSGPGGVPGELWAEAAGREARSAMDALVAAATGDPLHPRDYTTLVENHLRSKQVRTPTAARPDLMIWGTLEARVQGADLVILAGLSEGVWPEAPPPDPWLNRAMRRDAGLLLPERRIGLAAHDFQQAACAPEVVFSRSTRDAEAETVPSRWLNRLTNLLGGLSETGGPEALTAMRQRGEVWLVQARAARARHLPAPAAPRPSPRPPVPIRPADLSVTDIQRLVRDPYAIYAARVLRLRKLDPLRPAPDALRKGIEMHSVFERMIEDRLDPASDSFADDLLDIARRAFADLPWRAERAIWLAQIARIAPWLQEGEARRQTDLAQSWVEKVARFPVPGTGVTLTAKADRIDQLGDGRLAIYDYKTGSVPSLDQMLYFDRQLPIEAVMAEAGAFDGVPAAPVATMGHIGVGSSPADTAHALGEPLKRHGKDPVTFDTKSVLAELRTLLARYGDPTRGYTALRAMETVNYGSDYAHLARYGEWDLGDPPTPEDVG